MYSSPHQACQYLWHPECWHVRWHEEGAINVWIGHKIDNVSHQNAAWTYSGDARRQGWDVWLVRAVSRACQLILISSRSLSLGPGYEDLQHYSHQRGSFPSSLDHARSIISRSVFVCDSFGWIIYCNNECLWWCENTSEYWLLASYPHSHFYWGL